MQACLDILNSGYLSEELDEALLVFIPEKESPQSLDLRPITLYNVLYKIVVKTLANRRLGLIVDSVTIAHELCHYLMNRRKGKR